METEKPAAGRCWRAMLKDARTSAHDSTYAQEAIMENQKLILETLLDIRKLLAIQVGAHELHDWCDAKTGCFAPF